MTKIDIVSTTPVDEVQEEFLPYYLGDSPEDAEETYEKFSRLMNIMANAYVTHTNGLLEDYFAEAVKGLARAKRDWDETRGGCQFKTFAILKIKNALNECCRKNNSIVSTPHYVKVAHTYVTNIKTILEGYDVGRSNIEFVLFGGECPAFEFFAESDFERLVAELAKLVKLAKNSGVRLADLSKRAEFIPSDMAYDESMSQEELHKREQRRLAAALMVSKLEDDMTDKELHVARGIMAGHSYAEIGRTHDPKMSIAWVQKKVNGMRDKFQKKGD
jgi:hypothetical protein